MTQITFVLAAVIVAIAHVARALTPGFHYCYQEITSSGKKEKPFPSARESQAVLPRTVTDMLAFSQGYTDYEMWQVVYDAHLEPLATDNLLFTYNADKSISVNKTCSRGCFGGIPGGAVCIPDWVPEGQYVGSDIADRLAQGQLE
ncbi:hypothetical protein E4U19_006184 [Claviceps sp. Clav32 group G5]|nr:hypothetical protein E4U19_006184 [Claviceps sp. Clav32 group G5]